MLIYINIYLYINYIHINKYINYIYVNKNQRKSTRKSNGGGCLLRCGRKILKKSAATDAKEHNRKIKCLLLNNMLTQAQRMHKV